MLISFSPSAAADILFTLLLLAGGGVCVPFEYSLSVPLLPTLSRESLRCRKQHFARTLTNAKPSLQILMGSAVSGAWLLALSLG
jgi:hypothetical protein